MMGFLCEAKQLRTVAGARRCIAELYDEIWRNTKVLGYDNHKKAMPDMMKYFLDTVPFQLDDRHNLEVAYMDMDIAVQERKEVLESADVYRWCAYKGYAPPEGKAEEGRRRRQMYREIAECPYVSPEHRAAARAHLPRTKGKKPE